MVVPVALDVGPVVVGRDVRLHGDGSFVFVQEEFHQYVVRSVLAVEHQLDVRRHRNQFVDGDFLVQVLDVRVCAHGLLEAQQIGQRKNGTVVAEAERQRGAAGADHAVGDTDDAVAHFLHLQVVVSDICVFSNAIIAKASASPYCKIKIVRNATSSFDIEMQEKSFDVLKHLHIEII